MGMTATEAKIKTELARTADAETRATVTKTVEQILMNIDHDAMNGYYENISWGDDDMTDAETEGVCHLLTKSGYKVLFDPIGNRFDTNWASASLPEIDMDKIEAFDRLHP